MTFVTIAIPTFNRAVKLERLLMQLLNVNVRDETLRLGIEILIANNASNDNTSNIVNSYSTDLEEKGYLFTYIERPKNIGLDENMLNCYLESKGDYVWYFSDDDILIENIESVMKDLVYHKPSVCISNFKEDGYSDTNLVFDFKGSIKIEESIENAVRDIIKFPKITAYIAKRKDIEIYKDYLISLSGTYYLFVALMIILVLSESRTLMLRKSIIAASDEGHRNLRYSPRIFANRYKVANETLIVMNEPEVARHFFSNPNLPIFWCLYFIYLHYKKEYTLEPSILRQEIKYVLKNIYRIPLILFCGQCYVKIINKLMRK